MQKDDAVSLKDAHLSLDGNIAGTSLHGTLRLTHTETGDILLSPIAQAQLLDYLYHQSSIV
jgi:hypothetical protein